MPPKKKGKKKSPVKMTAEEKTKWLEQKAAAAEDQRRKRQELINAFLKLKIQQEEKYSRLNDSKLTEQWRQDMRNNKVELLQTEVKHLWHSFDHAVDTSDETISLLLQHLIGAQQMHQMAIETHSEAVTAMLGLHERRLNELHQWSEANVNSLLNKMNFLRSRLIDNYKTTRTLVSEVNSTDNQLFKEEEKRVNSQFTTSMDEYKNESIQELETMRAACAVRMEEINSNMKRMVLDHKERSKTKQEIYDHFAEREIINKEVETNRIKIADLKAKLNDVNNRYDSMNNDHNKVMVELEKEHIRLHDETHQKRIHLAKLNRQRTDKERKLLTAQKTVMKELDKRIQLGEKVLVMQEVCKRVEDNLPPLVGIDAFVKRDPDQESFDSVEDQVIKQNLVDLDPLNTIWFRHNNILMANASLKKLIQESKLENSQLRKILGVEKMAGEGDVMKMTYEDVISKETTTKPSPGKLFRKPKPLSVAKQHIFGGQQLAHAKSSAVHAFFNNVQVTGRPFTAPNGSKVIGFITTSPL